MIYEYVCSTKGSYEEAEITVVGYETIDSSDEVCCYRKPGPRGVQYLAIEWENIGKVTYNSTSRSMSLMLRYPDITKAMHLFEANVMDRYHKAMKMAERAGADLASFKLLQLSVCPELEATVA